MQLSLPAWDLTMSPAPQKILVLKATTMASRIPIMASPATRPEATSKPRFSTASLAFLSSPSLRAASRSAIHLMRPPTKMAAVVVKGRYMPTAMSMGDGDPMRISATAKSMPIMM